MSLQDPSAKMSKSDPDENGFVAMTDPPEVIARKFKRAVTDSLACVKAGEDRPGVTNLMSIYAAFTGRTFGQIEDEFAGRGYGDFKAAVADAVIAALSPIQAEQKRLLADKAYLHGILAEGAQKAARLANKTLAKVYKKTGFYQL